MPNGVNIAKYLPHVDGIFGDLTDSVVRQFQKSSHLNVDGIVAAKTWEAFIS